MIKAGNTIDIARNRSSVKYTPNEIVLRVVWSFASLLFWFSPRPCFGWRRIILRLMGAKVGQRVHIYSSSRIYYPWMLEIGDDSSIGEEAFIYNLGKVTIGRRATISHRAHLCAGTHDYTDCAFPLLRPSIEVGDDVWVCADAFVGPGVSIESGAVVGARAAVFRDVPPWTVVMGNPAQEIKPRILAAKSSLKNGANKNVDTVSDDL